MEQINEVLKCRARASCKQAIHHYWMASMWYMLQQKIVSGEFCIKVIFSENKDQEMLFFISCFCGIMISLADFN
jgi:hypothetical protein